MYFRQMQTPGLGCYSYLIGCPAAGAHITDSLNIGFEKQLANWVGMSVDPDARASKYPQTDKERFVMVRYEYDFGTYEIHERYILGQPHEGAMIGKREIRLLIKMGNKHYNHPFGMISDRFNPSSRHLAIFEPIMKENKWLHAVAIVSYQPLTALWAENERMLLPGIPFRIFNELDEAKRWVIETLDAACVPKTPA